MGLPPVAWILVSVVAFFTASWLATALMRRGRAEFRIQLFEVLEAAVRRGRPLTQIVAASLETHHGQRAAVLDTIHSAIDTGATLSDALTAAGPRWFPVDCVAQVRAAESANRLAPTLEALTRDTDESLLQQHRIHVALAYPTMLAVVCVVLVFTMAWRMPPIPIGGSVSRSVAPLDLRFLTAILACGVAGAFVATRMLWQRFAGQRRTPAQELHMIASHLHAGQSLAAAMRAAGPALEPAASAIERGQSAHDAWRHSGFPDFVNVRATAASAMPAPRLAATLTELANECRERSRARTRRATAMLQPIGLLVFASLLAVQFFTLIDWLHTALTGTMQ